jgi:DNA-binding beta-propeller fold protein YncE
MKDRKTRGSLAVLSTISVLGALLLLNLGAAYAQQGGAGPHNTITTIASTVPSNGDINPYGVWRVPRSVGMLKRGNILVSNFNNSSNLQGTGTTIVQIAPDGTFSLFAQIDPNNLPGPCPGGVGLTTALVVLRSGWVIVGSLPTADGTAQTAQAGCLIVLDSNGNVVETITDTQINGPWDMTALDASGDGDDIRIQPGDDDHHGRNATLFVTNVLNGTVAGGGQIVNKGTVIRIVLDVSSGPPSVKSLTVIGSEFPERTDPAALVIGPTGVALSKNNDTLYVADSLNNRIAAIDDPLTRHSSDHTGSTLTSGGVLNDPLGLTLAVDGDVLTTNGNDGYLLETTRRGKQEFSMLLDNTGNPPGAGALFGLVAVPGQGIYFVDDITNTLNLLH